MQQILKKLILPVFIVFACNAAIAQVNNTGNTGSTSNVFIPPAQPDPVQQPNSSGIQTTTPYEPAISGTPGFVPNQQAPETGAQTIPGVQEVTTPMQTQPTATNPNTENTGSPGSPPRS
jgi:hypothetical protein